ncbi:hypothetical protein ScPMuIL_003901 [Solemya velum]
MMQESKLTNFQMRELNKACRDGSSLPIQCPPTSSVRKKVQMPVRQPDKVLNPRNYSGGVRSKDTMEEMGAFEKPDYTPLPSTVPNSQKEKEKLANIMEFGEDLPKKKKKPVTPPPPPPKVDRFDELQKEVDDRKQFLEDMEALGQGKKFRTVIATEISQLVREMELIDRQRTAELERLLAAEEKKRHRDGS